MTGMPNASSNRLSAEGGSGAEAERMKRTRPGGRVASGGAEGGSMASTVMMAGTALIQVIRCAAISAQNPRRLNFAVEHQAGPGGQGREQSDHLSVDVEHREAAVAPVGRRQPVVAGHGCGDMGQLILAQQDALGRPGGPARAQEDPAGPGPGDAPAGLTACSVSGTRPVRWARVPCPAPRAA